MKNNSHLAHKWWRLKDFILRNLHKLQRFPTNIKHAAKRSFFWTLYWIINRSIEARGHYLSAKCKIKNRIAEIGAGWNEKFKEQMKEEFQNLKLNLSWFFNRTFTTEIVTVSMTKRCNLNCTYCWDHDTREKLDEMSTEEILKIIDDSRRLGAKVFNVFGGEPFIRKDTPDIIKYALKSGLRVTVTTNGTLLSKEKCEEIIKAANLQKLTFLVSLDGANPEENDFIRNKGSFEKTTQCIREIQELRQRLQNNVGLVMNTVVSRNNYLSMKKQLDLAKALGVDCIHYITPVISSNEVHLDMRDRELIILPEEFEALDRAIDEILIEKEKSPKIILNNYESLVNFKQYYRRQHELHQKFIQNYKKDVVYTQAQMS